MHIMYLTIGFDERKQSEAVCFVFFIVDSHEMELSSGIGFRNVDPVWGTQSGMEFNYLALRSAACQKQCCLC